ncbi:MAG: plectin [Ruminococcus sp.]|nr:plectin [Ruminococcus sp.]
MAEPRFIKTVSFGGYEKAGVVQRFESLSSQVHDLRNELRETKFIMEAYRKGSDEEKAYEDVLAEERAKLTQVQVQNNTLSMKLKATEDENNTLRDEIKGLNNELAAMRDKLKATESKCAALMAQDEAMALSNVFIEAQKSSAMLEGSAKTKAAEIEYKSKKLAEDTIADANVVAEQIIYEAEKTAAEKLAEAKTNCEHMEASANNMKAAALNDIDALKKQLLIMQDAFRSFQENGLAKLTDTAKTVAETESILKEGGVPVFREPGQVEPDVPEKPITLSEKLREDMKNEEERRKKKEELDKLRQMAESINTGKVSSGQEGADQEEESPAYGKQEGAAEEAQGSDGEKKPVTGEKKGGKIDLAALAAKAKSIGKQ